MTEVFIAHASHCKDCDDAVLSVATYLNMTGHCKCSLDLCSLPKEWSPGMTQYYENQISKCPKVIVLFTVNKNHDCEDTIKGQYKVYRAVIQQKKTAMSVLTTVYVQYIACNNHQRSIFSDLYWIISISTGLYQLVQKQRKCVDWAYREKLLPFSRLMFCLTCMNTRMAS